MGIRNTSYYSWEQFKILESTSKILYVAPTAFDLKINSSGTLFCCVRSDGWQVLRSDDDGHSWDSVDGLPSGTPYAMAIDLNDVIYVVGEGITNSENWIVRRSTTGRSGSFVYADNVSAIPGGAGGSDIPYGVDTDSSGSVYVVGIEEGSDNQDFNWVVRKSTTGLTGSFNYIDHVPGFIDSAISNIGARAISVDSQDNVYVAGSTNIFSEVTHLTVRKSDTGLSGSFSYVDTRNSAFASDSYTGIEIDSDDNIYVVGTEGFLSPNNQNWITRKSATGASGSFAYIDSTDRNGNTDLGKGIAIGPQNEVYTIGNETDASWLLRRSASGASGTFSEIASFDPRIASADLSEKVTVSSDGTVYIVGALANKVILNKGKLTANSASLGPRMLASSIGYVHEEPVSGPIVEKFKLNNISEFPHSSGIYQMPNLILGTTDSGKVGTTDDDIIQIKHFGSVVSIMWPKQGDQDEPVLGYGDLSAGQRPGKLTTMFDPGDFMDVTEFDHMALYCYLLKNNSGTLDNIDVQIERRPLRSSAFAVEQQLSSSFSGSYSIETLKDLIYRKSVDYGDLSIKEIGYPIDITLENTREIRISCRQQLGQSNDKNTNLIVWGRLISQEDGET